MRRALVGLAHSDVADAGPGVEPGAERPERAVVRGHRASSEADCRHQESAALVEHVYSITLSAWRMTACGIVMFSAFAALRLIGL